VKHVACIGERSAYRVLVGEHEGRDILEDLVVAESMILNCTFVGLWNGLIWLRIGTGNSFVNAVMNRFV
jgi:hypothetical protein